jgi:hypothetical protein
MGFNKKYIPEYDVVVKEILTLDSTAFVRRYTSADAWIGPSDSISLINAYLDEYYEGSKDLKEGFIERRQKRYDSI